MVYVYLYLIIHNNEQYIRTRDWGDVMFQLHFNSVSRVKFIFILVAIGEGGDGENESEKFPTYYPAKIFEDENNKNPADRADRLSELDRLNAHFVYVHSRTSLRSSTYLF